MVYLMERALDAEEKPLQIYPFTEPASREDPKD
jgi:hypothetical protein